MREVSVRDFGINPTKYLRTLPIILTQYKKPVAVLTPYKEPVKRKSVDTLKEEEWWNEPPVRELTYEPPPQPQVIPGKTAACPKCGDVVPIQFANKHYMDKHEI